MAYATFFKTCEYLSMGELIKIKGIGPKIEQHFINLGINSIKDLVYYFPRDYEAYED